MTPEGTWHSAEGSAEAAAEEGRRKRSLVVLSALRVFRKHALPSLQAPPCLRVQQVGPEPTGAQEEPVESVEASVHPSSPPLCQAALPLTSQPSSLTSQPSPPDQLLLKAPTEGHSLWRHWQPSPDRRAADLVAPVPQEGGQAVHPGQTLGGALEEGQQDLAGAAAFHPVRHVAAVTVTPVQSERPRHRSTWAHRLAREGSSVGRDRTLAAPSLILAWSSSGVISEV